MVYTPLLAVAEFVVHVLFTPLPVHPGGMVPEAGGVSVTTAVPNLLESATLVAVTVTV
jgi:hypothetical protein